ncbi:MAG: amidohydrolase family protein [Myxococcota bacterium]
MTSAKISRRRALTGLAAAAAVPTLGLGSAHAAPAARRARRGRAPAEPATLPFDDPEAGHLIFVGGRVEVGDGTVHERGVVEVRGTRIVSVRAGDAGNVAGATVIDLQGKRITPGFIAAATPLGLVEIDMEGSTVDAERHGDPIRSGYDASEAVHADSSLIQVSAIEGITSAAVTPRGGLLSGQVAWIDLVAGDHAGIVAKSKIAAAGQLGRTVSGSRAATLTRLREVLDDAAVYRDKRGAFDKRQTRDLSAHRLDLEALGPVLDGEVPLVVRAHRASDLLALVRLAKESSLRLAIIGAAQGWKVASALAEAQIPVIVQPSSNLPQSLDQLGARMDNAARLHKAGVPVGIAVLGEAHNIRNVTQEAGLAVSYGLPHEVAIRAISLQLAQIYGMDAHYGSVAAGKVANLAVWEGDPLELSQMPQQVYVRGRAIPMRSRQTLLRDRYRDLRPFAREDDG